MKLVVALALAPVASALVAPSAPAASKTVLADAKSDLVDLQNSIPGPPGFYDPLGLSDMSFALGMQGNADGGVRLLGRLDGRRVRGGHDNCFWDWRRDDCAHPLRRGLSRLGRARGAAPQRLVAGGSWRWTCGRYARGVGAMCQ